MRRSAEGPIPPALAPAPRDGASAMARLRNITLALLGTFILMIVGGLGRHIAVGRDEAFEAAMNQARAVVSGAEERTARTLGDTYRVIEGLGDVYRSQIEHGGFNEQQLRAIMTERLSQMPFVFTFLLTQPDGQVLLNARPFPVTKPGNIFRAMSQSHPTDGAGRAVYPMFRGVLEDNKTPQWFLPVGVSVHDKDGTEIAYLIAAIIPGTFEAYFKKSDVGAQGKIGLWTSEGQLIAASANETTAVGTVLPDMKDDFAQIPRQGQTQEPFVRATRGKMPQEIVSEGYVESSPLVVSAKLSGADYLATWWRDSLYLLPGTLAVFAFMAGCAAIILHQFSLAHRNQDALRRAKAAAEEASEAKSRFLAHMSHEFRTPLNAIMGFADIIRTKDLGQPIAPVYLTYADDIHRSGEHLLNIVNDILDMAKIESGAQTIQRMPTDIRTVVDGSLAFVEQLARQCEVTIRSEHTDRLPQVSSDERFVRQVLINLLSNAIKFSARGGSIVVRTGINSGGGLDVSVTDEGPGIDPVILRRIGEPFLQADPALTRAGQGTGLGLSICKHYMTLLGGELVVDSALGRGTTAIMRFPRSLSIAQMPA